MKRLVEIASCLILVFFCSVAFAQADPFASGEENKTKSEALFKEGRKLWKQDKRIEACVKFRKSHEILPTVGNLLNLGRCQEALGHYASAYKFYSDAATLAEESGQPARAEAAKKFANKAKTHISYLTVTLPKGVANVEVRLNGKSLSIPVPAQPIPLDPGEYTITAIAAGYRTFEGTARLAEKGDRKTIEVKLVPVAGVVPTATTPPPPVPITAPPPPPPPPPPGEGMSGLRIGGFAVGGLGLIGMTVGIGAGVSASTTQSDVDGRCVNKQCNNADLTLINDAKGVADLSTAAFVLGGALVAAGVTMIVLGAGSSDGSDKADALVLPWVGNGAGGLGIVGSF